MKTSCCLGTHCCLASCIKSDKKEKIGMLMTLREKRPSAQEFFSGNLLVRLAAIFLLFFGIALGSNGSAYAAETRFSGIVSVDTVWRLSDSPYILQGNVELDQGATLTIEAGVELRMEPGASFAVRQGALKAIGTAGKPILVTSSNPTKAPGDWGAWRFLQGTRSPETILENMRFEYGSGIIIQGASPVFNRVLIVNNTGPAIKSDLKSSPTGSGNQAVGNDINAILLPSGVVTGQIEWGLKGIPYLIESGLVEVGAGNQLRIEPQNFQVGMGESTSVRLVLDEPASTGGKTLNVTSTPAGYIASPSELVIAEGLKEVSFSVQGQQIGSGLLKVEQAELGAAQADFRVFELPALGIDAEHWNVATQMTYRAKVRLPAPAPQGGVKAQLAAEPLGWAELPSEVDIPGGQQEAVFNFKPTTSGGFDLIASSVGYKRIAKRVISYPMHLSLMAASHLEYIVNLGEAISFGLELNRPAPLGGLDINVVSSDAGVLKPIQSVVKVPEGSTKLQDGISLRGESKGRSSVYVTAEGVAASSSVYVSVRMPVVLVFYADPVIIVGSGMQKTYGISIARTREGAGVYDNVPLEVSLKCSSGSVCAVPERVTIPAGANSVTVPVTGLAEGEATLEATAQGVISATHPVQVVAPKFGWFGAVKPSDGESYERVVLSDEEDVDRYAHYMSEPQFYMLCTAMADDYSAQQVLVQARQFTVGLLNIVPEGVVNQLLDPLTLQPTAIMSVDADQACSAPIKISDPVDIGKYQIRASSSGGGDIDSPVISIKSDNGLRFDVCNDGCRDLDVVKGFTGNTFALLSYKGNWCHYFGEEITLRLSCQDPLICSVPAEIKIPPDNECSRGFIPVTGLQVGSTQIEAVVVSHPQIYRGSFTARVTVEPNNLVVPWVPAFKTGPDPVDVQVCIGTGYNSYSANDLTLTSTSSAPSVFVPVVSSQVLPAGESCASIGVRVTATGSADLTVQAPGLNPVVLNIEVRE